MDSHGSVDETTQAALKGFGAGNHRGALASLLPLLGAKEKLVVETERLLPLLRRLQGRVAARAAGSS
jgi:hypothetical protein